MRQMRLDPDPTPLDALIARMLQVLPDPPAFGKQAVGCSRATDQKHPIYLGTVQWLTTMHTPLVSRGAQFLCVETHAGPGWYTNSATGCETVGSPLIDLDMLDHHRLFASRSYRAVFCDKGDPPRIVDQLRSAIREGGFGTHGQVDVLQGRCEDELPSYFDRLRGWHCGVLFADANGSISHGLVDLFQTFKVLRNVDVVLWHQAHVRNRFNGLGPESTGPGGRWHTHVQTYDYRPLREILPDFGKERWLIRRPFSTGSNTAWTMLIGSNMPNLPEWTANEFYYFDSLQGQAILAECDG